MTLYKDGQFIEDSWRLVPEGEDVPPSGHVILPLDWWTAEREAFEGSNVPLGLCIEPGTRIEDFAADISRFSVIALVFPKFQDGRAYSTAKLLRERYGYTGELRAVGDVLIDQIQIMARCGFDAFEISDPATERALRAGKIPGVFHFYQPGIGAEVPAGRSWTRSPSKVAQ